MTIQVLIVDDSASVREALRELIDGEPGMRVMAKAGDPFKAVEIIKRQVPDVIILDIELPRMDGLSFLRRLMAQRPIPVIICSSLVAQGNARFLEAMRAGAVEVIAKPKVASAKMFAESRIHIADKIRAAARARLSAVAARRPAAPPVDPRRKLTADAVLPARRPPASPAAVGEREPIIAIGASTGGTQALETLFKGLDAGVAGIVVVQHMPEMFTRAFAQRLDQVCPIEVKEAQTGDPVRAGLALIAPGNRHLVVRRRGRGYCCEVVEGPLVSRHRPSVDVLFRSVAQAAGGPAALGVIMTGMGDDGARGLAEMREAGARTLGQNERSCVVYGMPAEAARLGAVERECDLASLGRLVREFARTAPVRRPPPAARPA